MLDQPTEMCKFHGNPNSEFNTMRLESKFTERAKLDNERKNTFSCLREILERVYLFKVSFILLK